MTILAQDRIGFTVGAWLLEIVARKLRASFSLSTSPSDESHGDADNLFQWSARATF